MPTVPSLDPSQLATPSQSSDFQGSSAVSATLLDQGAQQFSDAGTAISQASDAQSQIAVDVQNRINQTRVDDAMNAAQAQAYTLKFDPQIGYVNKTGAAAITPDASGTLPADAALQKLNDSAQDVRQNLTPVQQREFDLRYGQLATQFHGEALAHEGQQTRQYSLDTNNGTLSLAKTAAAQDYASPPLLDEHIQNAGNAAYKNAQVQGLQGPALAASVQQAQSDTAMTAYQAAVASGDYATATAIRAKYGSQMTADHAVEMDRTQTMIGNQVTAQAVARSAIAPAIAASTPAGQAFAANVSVESSGNQGAISPKGAVGIAQVMPTTGPEAAEAAGVPWDPVAYRNDPAYNRTIGQAYWQKQLAANGGDMAKADAAYNGGPGALQSAVDKANAAGTPNAWLQFMSPETQAYVPKVAALRQGGTATYTRATLPDKATVMQAALNDPRVAGNPIAAKAAADATGSLWDAQNEAVSQNEHKALASAQATLFQNGGNLSQVPPLTLAAINPADLPSLQEYAGKIRQGGTTTNSALYADIMNNPQKYAGMPDAQWQTVAQPNLSQSDFQQLSKQRADINNGTSNLSPGSVDTQSVKETVDNAAQQMGLNPRAPMNPNGDTSSTERIGALYKGANDYVLAKQKQVGKKLSPADTQAAVNEFLTTNVPAQSGGLFSSSQPMQLQNVTVDNIPDAIKTQLKAKLKTVGVPNPTDGQLLNSYLHLPPSMRGDTQ